ncbi:MAG: MopE-related protein [Pseudomonadota bacterium]|nr:MopE-related protein [Pseudomonadota bacterium]
MTVSYARSLDHGCAGSAWEPVQSSTWVDGVRTGDANWAADEAYDAAAWVDTDDDGWAAPTDCDDTDAAVNPAAADLGGDPVDDNCDGEAYDIDGDGYDTDTFDRFDCDDTDAAVHPGAADACGDGVDTNCDDYDGSDCDGDGYDLHSRRGDSFDDCDGTDATVHPDATEVPCDGVSNDCRLHDEDCDEDGEGSLSGDCDDTEPTVYAGADDPPHDGVDADCDGIDGVDDDRDGHDVTVDCDDTDALTFPGAPEDCGDHHDQDCDGLDGPCGGAGVDEEEPPAPVARGCTAVGPANGAPVGALLLSLALLVRRRDTARG